MVVKSYGLALRGLFSLGLALLVACGQPKEKKNHHQELIECWMTADSKVKVLCTTVMIEDLVRRIGGEQTVTLTLITGQLDPHSYQLVKGDAEKLAYADIIFYNGLGLEHSPSLRHQLIQNSRAIAVGDGIGKAEPEALLYVDDVVDPHLWMDISLWAKAIDVIVEGLKWQDPEHGELYISRGEELRQEMLNAHESVKGFLEVVPEEYRYLVTSHDAFRYFARAYLATADERMSGTWLKRFAAPEGISPESMLSTTDIQKILDYLVEHNVRVLFLESNVSSDSIRKIVSAGRESGLLLRIADGVLYSDAMGGANSGADTYLKMIKHNVETVATQLMLRDAEE